MSAPKRPVGTVLPSKADAVATNRSNNGCATAGGAAAAPAEAAEEQTEFTVVLTAGGDKKINVIKEVRGVRSDLGLKEAKDLVEGAPQNVVENVSKQNADEVAKKLTEAGAKVQIK